MTRLRPAGLFLALVLPACHRPAPPVEPPAGPTPLAAEFDAAGCGTVAGRVVWDGPVPAFPPISSGVWANGAVQYTRVPNPNAPRVDPATHGVAGAVVFLEQVSPGRSRPWDHAAVRVEVHASDIRVVQGDTADRVGFARRGDAVELVSRDPAIHALCARGAAFFSLPLPDPDRPLRRVLSEAGLVDLTSGAGKYWHQAYLFVSDHPYFARTDAAGRFTLPQVPAGDYVVVCWHPDGTLAGIDRDPNIGGELRRRYAPPLERRRAVTVAAGAGATADFRLER